MERWMISGKLTTARARNIKENKGEKNRLVCNIFRYTLNQDKKDIKMHFQYYPDTSSVCDFIQLLSCTPIADTGV